MVAAWSGVGCLPCRLDKANCCCLSLSLTLSLDPCSIPPRPVRPNQTETFKQSQRPTKASQMRAGLFRARKRRAWPYPIWHIQYILSVRIHHIVYRIHMYYMAWAAIKITMFVHFWNAHAIWVPPSIAGNWIKLFTFDHNSKFTSQKCNHKKHPEKCHFDRRNKFPWGVRRRFTVQFQSGFGFRFLSCPGCF